MTWVTESPADVLLREHPLVDRVLLANGDGAIALAALEFDVAFVIDKSLKATGLLRATRARETYGYVANARTGAIEPATAAAEPSWQLGLSDHLKFHVNRKPETQLIHDALELGEYQRDPYSLVLNAGESLEVKRRRSLWSDDGRIAVIGLNTGCAATIEYKKLSVAGHVELLSRLHSLAASSRKELTYVLLGGREDSIRNREIAVSARRGGITVLESSTDLGLRDGMMSVASCDVVVSGDSLGLHMALGLKVPVVAWFGPTCAHEIDLYGGVAIQSEAPCAPCWKRSCDKKVMCYDQVDFTKMARATLELAAPRPVEQLEITREI